MTSHSWCACPTGSAEVVRESFRDDAVLLARSSKGPNETGETAIEVVGLTRRFGDLEAVRGVSFDVAAGETFGFLGPNGAGKSTTISMLCTLLRPTSGTARVAGFDVSTEQAEVRERIGLDFQDTTLDDYPTAEENLSFHVELYGVPRGQAAHRLRDVLDMVGLWERRDSLVRTFLGCHVPPQGCLRGFAPLTQVDRSPT